MPPLVAWWRPLFLIALMQIGVLGNLEGDALNAFRLNLVDTSNVLQSWDPTLVNPCTWFHVTCNGENSVTRVDLGNAGLSGTLVPQLGVLVNLQYLELYSNNISGPIPKELGNITDLVSLDLYQNNFTGTIPDSLGQLSNLRFLRLNNNSLTGTIPISLTTITGLQVLDVSSNMLSGEFPSSIFDTSGLQQLSISQNQFQGTIKTDAFQNMTNLWHLDLSRNNFTGQLPNVPDFLRELDFSSNMLSGEFPSSSFNSSGLQWLSISQNQFQGTIKKDAFQNLLHLLVLDISDNKFTGSPPILSDLQNLTTLNLSGNPFTGLSQNLPSYCTTLPQNLSVLDLSGLDIGGAVLYYWNNMSMFHDLSKLYLDRNNIVGKLDISAFVESTISKSLDVLSLNDNNITNVLSSDDLIKAGRTEIILQGNPYCSNIWHSQDDTGRCSVYCVHTCFYTPKSNNWKVIVTASTTSSAVILIFVILTFTFILCRNQEYIRDLQKKIKLADVNVKRFEYNELRVATRNFAPEMKLGAGANGAVYKGILPNNLVVAVKQLFQETNEIKDDFLNEILLISNLQHRNLVNLKGYCVHGKKTLLVYEYVDNYDLDKLLLSRLKLPADGTPNEQVLMWQARMNVCQGVAQGLYYLHASSESRIIHRDIKASNIMLDKNFHPKIADFGLARPIEESQSVILTLHCAGTLGYLAPEYMSHGQLSEKADVYSFGVLLLEIVSGKRNRDLSMPEDEVYLPMRAWKLHRENRLMDIIDAALVLRDDEAMEVQRVLETAVLCVQSDPKKRPSMFLVAAMLAGQAKVDIAPKDEDESWPERGTLDESDCENPLFTSSASAGSGRNGTLTNGNATTELSVVYSGR